MLSAPKFCDIHATREVCMAAGKTCHGALSNLEVVIEEWIETAKEMGGNVPEPRGPVDVCVAQTSRGETRVCCPRSRERCQGPENGKYVSLDKVIEKLARKLCKAKRGAT